VRDQLVKKTIPSLLCILFLATSAAASASTASFPKLVAETQRMHQTATEIVLVWWLPNEFWELTLADNPNVTESQRRDVLAVLDGYSIFVVAAMDIGPFGGITSRPESTIRDHTEFRIGDKRLAPLTRAEISIDAANFVSMMKPMMANMLGQFGEGMMFLVYPNGGESGAPKIGAKADGSFDYTAFGQRFEWKLPLPSVLPPMIDPETGQEFQGDFRFNPYTGGKLKPK
jgi:hypothetical protein